MLFGSRQLGLLPNRRMNLRRQTSFAIMSLKEMESGMSMDLSRRPISLCAIWRSRLESSRTANVFPSWRGSLYKVIGLSGDGHGVP